MNKQLIVRLIGLELELALLVLIPYSPAFNKIPERDSSVFIYSASQILQGNTLYLNLWDHKTPAIHFLDAVGLAMSNGSIWGIWVIELISLFITGVLLFYLIKETFSDKVAFLSTPFFYIILFKLLEGGNLTEEYILPLLVVAYILLFKALKSPSRIVYYGFFLGMIFGLCFLFRQNGIGLFISIFVFAPFVFKNVGTGTKVKSLIIFFIGLAIPILAVILYFYFQNALNSLYQATIVYNFTYSGTSSIQDKILNLSGNITSLLYLSPAFYLVFVGWILGFLFSVSQVLKTKLITVKNLKLLGIAISLLGFFLIIFLLAFKLRDVGGWAGFGVNQVFALMVGVLFLVFGFGLYQLITEQRVALLVTWDGFPLYNTGPGPSTLKYLIPFSVMSFLIELFIADFSFRSYPHYYMLILPTSIILISLFIKVLLEGVRREKENVSLYVVIAFIFVFSIDSINYFPQIIVDSRDRFEFYSQSISFIKENTKIDDYVLIWGNEPSLNFISGRKSPLRYFYQYPLYFNGFMSNDEQQGVLRDIRQKAPKLIIDTHNVCTPLFFEDLKGKCSNSVSPINHSLYDFIKNNYSLVKKVIDRDNEFDIYQYEQ